MQYLFNKRKIYIRREIQFCLWFSVYIYILYTSIIYFIILHNNQTYQSIDIVLITKLLKRERSLEKWLFSINSECVNFWVKFKYWRKFWMRSVEERWSIFRLQASHCSTDLIKIVRIPANDAPPQEFLHNPMQMSPCNGFQTVAVACNWALSRGRFVSRVDRLYNEYFLTARGFAITPFLPKRLRHIKEMKVGIFMLEDRRSISNAVRNIFDCPW